METKIIKSNTSTTLFYEIFIAILALIAVTLTILDIADIINLSTSVHFFWLDQVILYIFIIDFVIRLIISKVKLLVFLKRNIFDLIAILPFNSLFRIFRITRLLRMARLARIIKFTKLIRILAFLNIIKNRASSFFKTNGFNYAIYVTGITIILGAGAIYIIEKGLTVNSLGDALWWSFVTTTTVGYGDISPVTSTGRIIASILMIFGIGFVSMLTGTIATYFINKPQSKEKESSKLKNSIDVSDLNNKEIERILDYIDYMKSKRG